MKIPISRSLRSLFLLPKEALYILSGKKPIQVDNKTLDPGLQFVVTILNLMPGFESLSPVDARKAIDTLSGLIEAEVDYKGQITNLEIPVSNPIGKIPIRIYSPDRNGKEDLPVLVYSHGGGYVMASIDSHHHVCQLISQGANCIIVSVGYRLAPEFKFPTAVYDVQDTFKWVWENVKRIGGIQDKIAIGGDSAGATLSTVACHEFRETIYKPFFQLLIYPGTDASKRSKSRELYGEDFFLTGKQIDWFIGNYLNNDEEAFSPLISPLLYKNFSGLPPTYISTAGLDPVFDDGFKYMQKLLEGKTKVVYETFPSLIHGYINMTAIPACKAALDSAIRELKNAFRY